MAGLSTRDHLIDVGVALMHRHGYNATGLSEILSDAQVPKGSFYHHFGSKEEFAVAVLGRYATRESEHCEAVLGDTKLPPLKRLRRYFADLIRTNGPKGEISGCLLGRFSLEAADQSDLLRKHLSNLFDYWQKSVATVIQLAIDSHELPANTNAEALAGFVLNSWQGALVRSEADQSDDALKAFMHYTFDGLLSNKSS
jgi:TetR/AcrR family transcriptional regulator, transcriptional repressor for nem operon